MGKHAINYQALALHFLRLPAPNRTAAEGRNDFFTFLACELAGLWCEEYVRMPNDRVEIVQLTDAGYEFLFDIGSERVIAAFGITRYEPD